MLTLENSVARGIAEGIRVTLTPEDQSRLSRTQSLDPEAFDAFAKGRFAWNRFTAEGAREAIDYFQEAIAKAPDYAPAYAGLADAYYALPTMRLSIRNRPSRSRSRPPGRHLSWIRRWPTLHGASLDGRSIRVGLVSGGTVSPASSGAQAELRGGPHVVRLVPSWVGRFDERSPKT